MLLQMLNDALVNVTTGNIFTDANSGFELLSERLQVHQCRLRLAGVMR